MSIIDFVKYISVGVVLLAGSCASPTLGAFIDPQANFPLNVTPQYAEADFVAPAPSAGLAPEDAARFGSFVASFLERGRGSISVSVPDTPDAPDMIAYLGEKLMSLGVPSTRILVGMHAAADARQVKLGYLGYRVQSADCGNWSEDRVNDTDNKPPQDWGCANQHNIAVQVANPYDLATSQPRDERDPVRRSDAVEKYEKGGTQKQESAKIASVGSGN